MFTRKTMALALVTLALGACAPDDADTDEALTDTTALAPTPPAASQLTEGQALHVVMTANTADSAGGEMAKTMARQPAVQDFAQRMIQDHGTANAQARQLGITAEDNPMSQQLQQSHQQASQQLHSLAGDAYDRAYIDHEVQMHQTLLDHLDQHVLPAAPNPQLQQYLQQLRTSVQSHLAQARQIQAQLGPGNTAPDTGTTTTGNS
jgi:putative membrane protein